MSRGNFYRSSLNRPRGRRRTERFGPNVRAPRPHRLPPSLLKGQRRRRKFRSISLVAQVFVALLLGFFVLTIIAGGGVIAGGFMGWSYLSSDLPTGEEVEALQFETTKIYDRHWRLLAEVSDPKTGWRTAVGYGEILGHIEEQQGDPNKPQRAWIFDATVAAEDATFWTNPGVDPMAILRGVVINFSGEGSSGASTITQQLVRALYPESIGFERSYTRKVREAITAFHFSREYSKEEILEMYLNHVYYGNRSYGIDAASQSYFNKHPWDLTLGEASLLAGLPQAPSLYDPTQNFELARARQRYVLDQMVDQGMITQVEAGAAYAEPLTPQSRENRVDLAPHFVNYVKYYVEQKYGADVLYRGGLMIRTTLDFDMQEEAQRIVADRVETLEPWDNNNAALVAMLPWSGEVIAMVGSADYYNDAIDGQVNVAVRERQPGSSIKPITYLAAFERGWYPGTMIMDYAKRWPTPGAPTPYYEPKNGSRNNYGAIPVREALGMSLNIPAVQALEYVGVPNMIDLAHKMGIRTGLWRGESFYGLAVTLGGGEVTLLEHTNAFATLANNGRYVPYSPLLEVIDNNGEKIFELDRANALANGEQVAQAEHAYQITHILSDDNARASVFGRGSVLTLPELNNRPVAAKTGTTEDARDGWTMGYTTDLVVGVWAGNTDNRPTRSLDGIAGAGPIWHDFMVAAHQNPEFAKTLLGPDGQAIPKEFPRPPKIKEIQVCAATGKLPISGARTVTEVVVDGESPKQRCNELDERERKELAAALEDASRNSRMLPAGRDRLYTYAEMAGLRARPQPTPSPGATDVDEDEEETAPTPTPAGETQPPATLPTPAGGTGGSDETEGSPAESDST